MTIGYSVRAAYGDLIPPDGGQSLYPMSTVYIPPLRDEIIIHPPSVQNTNAQSLDLNESMHIESMRKKRWKVLSRTATTCTFTQTENNRKNIAWGDFPPTQNIAPGHISPLFRDRFFLAEFFWAWHFRYLRMMLNKCLTIFAY